ncbi:hypothetical protein [Streptomyces sp. NPDC018031]|uniref:hypothetical protein n=1 Tax=Streptomyces sp. NPDC018031 TaxID=3365033 RepID=UPI0037A45549
MRTSVCRRRRATGRAFLAGAVSVVALMLTGCGGGGETDDVASATTGGSGASKGGGEGRGEIAEYVENQREYVACLRDKGLDVPDPDAKGRIDLGDGREVKSDPTFRRAQEACSDLAVPIPESLEKEARADLTSEERDQKKRYATCMQENGAPDFPGTDEDGYFEDTVWDQTSAGAKRATRECAPIIGAPTDPGQGKG